MKDTKPQFQAKKFLLSKDIIKKPFWRESYNPATDKCRKRVSMHEKLSVPGMDLIGDYLYAAAWPSAGKVCSMTAEKCDPEIDQWTIIRSSRTAECWMRVAYFFRKFVTVGGVPGGFRPPWTMGIHVEEKGNWVFMLSLSEPRWWLGAVEVSWRLAAIVSLRKVLKNFRLIQKGGVKGTSARCSLETYPTANPFIL